MAALAGTVTGAAIGTSSVHAGLIGNLTSTLSSVTSTVKDILHGGGSGGGGGGGGSGGGLLGGGSGGGLLGGGTTTTTTTTTTAPPPSGSGGGSGGTSGTGGGSGGGGAVTGGGGGHAGYAQHRRRARQRRAAAGATRPQPPFRPNGVPTRSNPTATIAPAAPAPLGISNAVINQFEIPPFLLPIYQACGTQYGIPWQVLAAINKIETGFGTNLNVSSAGAIGWMQFMPDTWRAWGVDATGDGRADPYNPVDAICSAARYLRASGGAADLRAAIFAYNHADWYVDEVLLYARQYGSLPPDLVSSLTALTEGDRFPVVARSRYADTPRRHRTDIYARRGAPVIAVNDGTIRRIGRTPRLGRFIVLEDTYGNRFIYSHLGRVERVYPAPRKRSGGEAARAAAAGEGAPAVALAARRAAARAAGEAVRRGPVNSEDIRRRIFALPERELGAAIGPPRVPGAGLAYAAPAARSSAILRYRPRKMELRPLRRGAHVVAGTLLARVGATVPGRAPHLSFQIRPAGKRSPLIDPKPILDGWKLLEATAIYRAAGQNPFAPSLTGASSITQVLLMPKSALERRVLGDPRLSIYPCGRNDIATGQIDRRVLAAMEYLAGRGYRLTITSLRCGHSRLTVSGYVSEHWTGDAMDIAAINGVPVAGHQGPGTLADAVIRDLLQLQGVMRPHQIISLESLGGPSFAMADHWDHIHVGYYPHGTAAGHGRPELAALLRPGQWVELIRRIARIPAPHVRRAPSRATLAAGAHGRRHHPLGD